MVLAFGTGGRLSEIALGVTAILVRMVIILRKEIEVVTMAMVWTKALICPFILIKIVVFTTKFSSERI